MAAGSISAQEMINLADTNDDGTVDGTAAEWATSYSFASDLTADGSVVVGRARDDTNTDRAFRWDADTGMVNLADTDGDGAVDGTAAEWATGRSSTSDMTADGSVVIGTARDDTNTDRAYRWDSDTHMVNLADTNGDGLVDGTAAEWATGRSSTSDMTADGSVVVEKANDDTNIQRVYRWDATTGMVNLADTNGDGTVNGTAAEWATGYAYARHMAADGSVVSGTATDATNISRAFRWDADTHMVNLADTNGDGTVDGTAAKWATGYSSASDMTADGSVVVGKAKDDTNIQRVY